MTTWKETIANIVGMLSEDKIVATLCLTALGGWSTIHYPVDAGLPILTAIIGSISGFVVGSKK